MIDPSRYTVKFNQVDLLRYVHSKKHITDAFTSQLTHVSNIDDSKEGICFGLAKNFISYENNNLGLEFVKQMNFVLNSANLNIRCKDPISKNINKASAEVAFPILKKHFIDSINPQIDHYQSIYYYNQSNQLETMPFDEKKGDETNAQYINHCLSKFKKTNDMLIFYGIDSHEELKFINELYKKIEDGVDVNQPEMRESEPAVYSKIRAKQNLTEKEIKLFLQDAYKYCALRCEYRTTLTNIKSGITYTNRKPPTSYENTNQRGRYITKAQLKDLINTAVAHKSNFYLIYSAQEHARVITGNYSPQSNNAVFCFFDPNEGVIQVDNINELFNILSQIPTDQYNSQEVAYIRVICQSKTLPAKRNLPSISEKEIQIRAKKLLVQDLTTLSFINKAQLIFSDYNQSNDELTLKLKIAGRTYTIYSELNDLNATLSIIENTMHEYSTYRTQDIYIDWKGQIANKLMMH